MAARLMRSMFGVATAHHPGTTVRKPLITQTLLLFEAILSLLDISAWPVYGPVYSVHARRCKLPCHVRLKTLSLQLFEATYRAAHVNARDRPGLPLRPALADIPSYARREQQVK